jgi:hypothetical protein
MRKLDICLLYVAISRVRKASDVHFVFENEEPFVPQGSHSGIMYEKYPYQIKFAQDIEITKEEIEKKAPEKQKLNLNDKMRIYRKMIGKKRKRQSSLRSSRPEKRTKTCDAIDVESGA